MKTVLLQLERLRRHYDIAVHTYDEVSLLDLSHILRIWTELKGPIKEIYPKFSDQKKFKTAIPVRKALKASRGYEFVFAYMPGGVITYASNGNILSEYNTDRSSDIFTAAAGFKYFEKKLELSSFYYVSRVFDQTISKALEKGVIKRCTFSQWLAAEVVRVAYPDGGGSINTVIISREMIVKRVANILDGSHPSASREGGTKNKFDAPIKYLQKYELGGISLPYFLLLKIAQDILCISSQDLHNQ